jgi:hypothetical protein
VRREVGRPIHALGIGRAAHAVNGGRVAGGRGGRTRIGYDPRKDLRALVGGRTSSLAAWSRLYGGYGIAAFRPCVRRIAPSDAW